MEILFKMLIGHAVADFALQSSEMDVGKNRNRVPAHVPPGQVVMTVWPYWLTAHALIHGGAVFIATENILLGIVEMSLHWAIDFAKCENWTTPHQDQALHILCKVAYTAAIINHGLG